MQQITAARHRWKPRHISSNGNSTGINTKAPALFVHWQSFLSTRVCSSSTQWFEYRIKIYCLLCLSLMFIACSHFQRNKNPQPELNGDVVVQLDCRLKISDLTLGARKRSFFRCTPLRWKLIIFFHFHHFIFTSCVLLPCALDLD